MKMQPLAPRHTVANTHQFNWVNAQGTVVGTDTDGAPEGFGTLLPIQSPRPWRVFARSAIS